MTGAIGWVDLTVPHAEEVRDFYAAVAGWTPKPLAMDGYDDYVMESNGTGVAGICHTLGQNAEIPPVWLVYITVDDLAASLAAVEQRGGRIAVPTRSSGDASRFAVVQDPAGAYVALYQQ